MKVSVLLKMIVTGRDGSATATRRIMLPCLPFEGLWIDGHRVLRADFQTKGNPDWILLLAGGGSTYGNARENLYGIVGNVDGWDVTFQETARDLRSGTFAKPRDPAVNAP